MHITNFPCEQMQCEIQRHLTCSQHCAIIYTSIEYAVIPNHQKETLYRQAMTSHSRIPLGHGLH